MDRVATSSPWRRRISRRSIPPSIWYVHVQSGGLSQERVNFDSTHFDHLCHVQVGDFAVHLAYHFILAFNHEIPMEVVAQYGILNTSFDEEIRQPAILGMGGRGRARGAGVVRGRFVEFEGLNQLQKIQQKFLECEMYDVR